MSFVRKLMLGALIGAVKSSPLAVRSEGQAIVDLGYSQYQGIELSNGINQFLGMRFAAPPLGDLRFRAPAAPSNTSGILNATSFQDICLGTGDAFPTAGEGEDCLFVNVWAPASASTQSKLPVWIYIQGGGYIANSNNNYNGSGVVDASGQNIVFVNFNYRVGPFGFLASEKVRENGDLNVGLLDQRMLFQWVQDNIQKFGGDPSHVVIHGASAGAGSVALHLTAHGGRDDGFFVGGIGESVFFPTQRQVSELEFQFERYANNTGCAGSADELDCIRSKDTAVLQAANVASPYPGQTAAPNFYWTPTIDGDFIQDYPYRLVEEGKFIKVPIIFGDDTNEGTAFVTNASSPADVAAFMVKNYPHLTTNDTNAINEQYPLMPPLPEHAAYFPSVAAAYGDSTFTCAGNFISQTFSRLNNPNQVWNYRYNVQDPPNIAKGVGVVHTAETPAIFGPAFVPNELTSSYVNINAEIVPVVMSYWISFIRDLNPNTFRFAGAPEWGNFEVGDVSGLRLKLQTNVTEMETIPRNESERCAFWKSLAITMEQ